MDIGELLKDFKSIKLPPKRREFVDDSRELFRSVGTVPVDIQRRLRKLASLYRRQFEELYASRERARKTLWRTREGISKEQAEELVTQRRKKIAEQKADLGI